MPRSKHLPWAVLALWVAAGCASGPERVTVDLGSIPAVPVSRGSRAAPTFTAQGLEPVQSELPGVPSQVLQLGSAQERLDAALRIVEGSRRQAYAQVLRLLQEAYRAEAQQWASERLAELAPGTVARYDAALATLMKSFLAYADRRGPKMARLTVLAGFPDPDPTSRLKADPSSPRALRSAAEAERLRGEIVELDRAFALEAKGLLTGAGAASAADRAALQHEIQSRFAEADARAEATATEQMAAARRDLDALLASRSEWTLKSEQSRSLAVPGSPGIPGLEMGDARPPSVDALQGDLDLWLRSRGYVLAGKGERGRDVTKEFMAWRASLQAGR